VIRARVLEDAYRMLEVRQEDGERLYTHPWGAQSAASASGALVIFASCLRWVVVGGASCRASKSICLLPGTCASGVG
jgi:hypothetical protein